jgi:hypothetical protein
MRTRKQPFMLSALAVLALSVSAAAQVPFHDHFDTTINSGWVVKNGASSVQNGWLHLIDTNPGFPRWSCMTLNEGDTTWRDYQFQTRFDPILTPSALGGPWMRGGMLWRSTDWSGPTSTAYGLQFVLPGDSSGTSRLDFSRQVNGDSGVMLQQITPFTPTLPMDVVVYANGHHIKVYINGSLLIDVVDVGGPLSGGVGIWNVWESEGRYDDISVTLLPPEPCPGDADGSRSVNFADITTVLANFGIACP